MSDLSAWHERNRRIDARNARYAEQGDHRARCDEAGHLICERCGHCACENGQGGDFEIRVSTDKQGRTIDQECRYDLDVYGLAQ